MQAMPLKPAETSYRPDIDGLRAVAVTAVVMYHVGVPGVSSGFIGVDIFFVISGYLITQQLAATSGRPFRQVLLEFYGRRCRRILPALALVSIATLVLGQIFLLPNGEQQDLAKSAIASAIFLSNIFFWQRARDYFAGPEQLQPLLHTWSLSVEEQFYLFWPFVLFTLMMIARHWRIAARSGVSAGILVISLASLAISIWWSTRSPVAAFYMTPSRVWQLGTGALLALLLRRHEHRQLANVLGPLGLLCVVLAATLYNRHTPYPGIAALLPIAGSALIIAAGALGGRGFVYRGLASALATLTGKISYAWYLWHWPLLAIARAADLGNHKFSRDLTLAAVAYGLAYLSTNYFETPIRQRRIAIFSTPWKAVTSGIAVTSVCVALSIGLWTLARAEYQEKYANLLPASAACLDRYVKGEHRVDDPCLLASSNGPIVFLIGDSEADHWSPAIAAWAKANGVQAIERTVSGCNILLASYADTGARTRYVLRDRENCVAFSRSVMQEIRSVAESGRLMGVVASARWENNMNDNNTELDRQIMGEDMNAGLGLLTHINARALLLGPTPEFEHHVPACVARRGEEQCRLARVRYEKKAEGANLILASTAARSPRIRYWNPASHFCDATWCYPTKDGQLWYSDENHLSRVGAESAEPDLAPYLDWLIRRERSND